MNLGLAHAKALGPQKLRGRGDAGRRGRGPDGFPSAPVFPRPLINVLHREHENFIVWLP